MNSSSRHILNQGPVIGALGRTAYFALLQGLGGRRAGSDPVTPGPEIRKRVSPLPRGLVDDYISHVGGDPRAYRGELPPHLFPKWCMPTLSRTLEHLPYPLLRAMNGGCRVQVNAPLPDHEPLEVCARLESIDNDGRRVVLHQTLRTGTASAPDALAIDFYAIVPLRGETGRRSDAPQPAAEASKRRSHVPDDAREVARIRLSKDAGLTFAMLTGDINPIHWLRPYARASGFADVILHGFGTLARAWEGLNKNVFGGDVHALTSFDVKFTRPLVLPHEIGLYVRGSEVFIGDAPAGPAYLVGVFSKRGKA
jgi:acyl dehydratase